MGPGLCERPWMLKVSSGLVPGEGCPRLVGRDEDLKKK